MIRLPDMHYFDLHLKCAQGTLNAVERIELDALCAIKEREWELENSPKGAGAKASDR